MEIPNKYQRKRQSIDAYCTSPKRPKFKQSKVKSPFPALPSFVVAAEILAFYNDLDAIRVVLQRVCH